MTHILPTMFGKKPSKKFSVLLRLSLKQAELIANELSK